MLLHVYIYTMADRNCIVVCWLSRRMTHTLRELDSTSTELSVQLLISTLFPTLNTHSFHLDVIVCVITRMRCTAVSTVASATRLELAGTHREEFPQFLLSCKPAVFLQSYLECILSECYKNYTSRSRGI